MVPLREGLERSLDYFKACVEREKAKVWAVVLEIFNFVEFV